jgi:5-methylcytosine-specific restriction endonuclease McrA
MHKAQSSAQAWKWLAVWLVREGLLDDRPDPAHGVEFMLEIAEDYLRIGCPESDNPERRRVAIFKAIAEDAAEMVATNGKAPKTRRKKAKRKAKKQRQRYVQPAHIKVFYQSAGWKRLRYDVLVENGGRCECCGRSAKDGATMNVDHIKPLKTHWHLRLERTNAQVLCGTCNAGKGNRDTTDWRAEAA